MARPAIHPGEHLAEELKALDMSAAELARQLKVPTNRVTGILNGQRAVTGDTALRLGHFFGTSGEFWLNLIGNWVNGRQAEKQIFDDGEIYMVTGALRVRQKWLPLRFGNIQRDGDFLAGGLGVGRRCA